MDTGRFEDVPFSRRAHRALPAVKAVTREDRETRRGGSFRFFRLGRPAAAAFLSTVPSRFTSASLPLTLPGRNVSGNLVRRRCRRTTYRSDHFNDRSRFRQSRGRVTRRGGTMVIKRIARNDGTIKFTYMYIRAIHSDDNSMWEYDERGKILRERLTLRISRNIEFMRNGISIGKKTRDEQIPKIFRTPKDAFPGFRRNANWNKSRKCVSYFRRIARPH